MNYSTHTILFVLLAFFGTCISSFAEIHNFKVFSEKNNTLPGDINLYKDIQAHRLHTVFLDTEIAKIYSGQLPDISIAEINRRVGMLEARMEYFTEITAKMDVTSSADMTLPQNLTIQEISFQFGSELSFLQATLLGGKSMSEKKYLKLKEENEAKIKKINEDIRLFTSTYGYDIIIIDPTEMPTGPDEVSAENYAFDWIDETTSVAKPPVSSAPQTDANPIAEETSIAEDIEEILEPTPAGPPPSLAELEGLTAKGGIAPEDMVEEKIEEAPQEIIETVTDEIAESPKPADEVIEEVAEEANPIADEPKVREEVIEEIAIETTPAIEVPNVVEKVVEEVAKPVEEKMPTDVNEPATPLEELADDQENPIKKAPSIRLEPNREKEKVSSTKPKTPKVSGEVVFYINEVARMQNELEKIKEIRFSNTNARDLYVEPIKERLNLIETRVTERQENEVTMAKIDLLLEEIANTRTAIKTFEAEPLYYETVAAKEKETIEQPTKKEKTNVVAKTTRENSQLIRYTVQGTEKWHFFYDTGQTQPRKYQVSRMQEIMTILNAAPQAGIVISGYTDQSGTADKNIELSRKRAEVVKTIFTQAGIDSDRVKIAALGEKGSIRSDDPYNRKVEIRMVLNQ
ncbi:MAG: OmpA family protein [Bacteroidota bacterium]